MKNREIREEIKRQRKKQGLTQKELASKAHIAEITLRKYEAEAIEHTEKTLMKIARALNIGEYYFLEYNKPLEGKSMTDREKCELKRNEEYILNHYTFIPQVQKLCEELNELIEAACGYVNGIDAEEHVIEEMADAEVMIDQMKIYFNAWDSVNCKKREKVDRQLIRISQEVSK